MARLYGFRALQVGIGLRGVTIGCGPRSVGVPSRWNGVREKKGRSTVGWGKRFEVLGVP